MNCRGNINGLQRSVVLLCEICDLLLRANYSHEEILLSIDVIEPVIIDLLALIKLLFCLRIYRVEYT